MIYGANVLLFMNTFSLPCRNPNRKLNRKPPAESLTSQRQIDSVVARGRVEVVHPAPVDATVGRFDVAYLQPGLLRCRPDRKEQPLAEVVRDGGMLGGRYRYAAARIQAVERNSGGIFKPQHQLDAVLRRRCRNVAR